MSTPPTICAPLVGPTELARRLGVTVAGLRYLENQGRVIPAMRIQSTGRRIWLESDADRIVAARQAQREKASELAG